MRLGSLHLVSVGMQQEEEEGQVALVECPSPIPDQGLHRDAIEGSALLALPGCETMNRLFGTPPVQRGHPLTEEQLANITPGVPSGVCMNNTWSASSSGALRVNSR